tara:strand:- start:468 stop:875 length:408 start_codon:yes stop_codon:yes gene_type:complete
MNRCVFLLLVLFCSACSKIGNAPERTFDVSNNTVDLSQEIKGDWDRVCIFTPYFNNQGAEEVLGFKFDIESKSGIYISDGITLLVVVNANEVTQYFEVPRNNIDFSSLKSDCYKKGDAKFKIIKGKTGWLSVQHT